MSVPPLSCPCLSTSCLSLSSETHLASLKHKLLLPGFLCILLSCPLPPFTMGVMLGVVLACYFMGRLLLNLACPKDNLRRVRLVASGDRRCPILWLVTLGFWNRRVQTKFITFKGREMVVVNLWPLQYGDFSEEMFSKLGTRLTHTAIVEVVGSELRIMYPVNNMHRNYVELDPHDQVEVFTFKHRISLPKAKISLTGVEDQPQSRKFSKKLPICVESFDCNQPHSFYIFPRIKRNKEALYTLLIKGHEEFKVESEVENLVERVIRDCRLKCFTEGGDDHSIEMINVILNRMGARFLTQEMIFDPIQKILKTKLNRQFGKFFKNLGVKNIDPGESYPLIKKVGKPWHNERGLWAKVVICETNDKRSITVEANQLNIPSAPNQSSSSDEADSPSFSTVQWIDQEIAQLAFTLDILQFELVFLLNIPPPGPPQLPPLRLWVGLCHLPLLDIQLAASGAKPGLTSLLNTIMPVVRAATLKKLNLTLETNWVYPNMKDFTFKL